MDLKRVLITGGNRGLGRDVIELLLSKNPQYQVFATARTNIETTQKQISSKFPLANLKFLKLDIESKASIERFSEEVKALNVRFDAIINNGAIMDRSKDVEIIQKHFNINVLGTISFTEAMLPFLKEKGRIINVSSKMAALKEHGKTIQEQFSNPNLTVEDMQIHIDNYLKCAKEDNFGEYFSSTYGTSKMMLNAWSRFILAKMVQPEQIIICMSPGHCKTDMGGPNAPRTSLEGATFIYNHLWGEYSVKNFYHSMMPFDYSACGPQ